MRIPGLIHDVRVVKITFLLLSTTSGLLAYFKAINSSSNIDIDKDMLAEK